MATQTLLPAGFSPLVQALAECFTRPSFVTFQVLLLGWVLCLGRHTVTGVLRASGALGTKHHSSFHRFFRKAVWSTDALGQSLVRLVIKLLVTEQRIVLALDDTLGRHTGKHIAAASMHHDPLLSTRAKPVFHWGHVWVVLAVVVRVPLWDRCFAVPVMVRLYRSEKTCTRTGRPFHKKTELAAQMVSAIARLLPQRRFVVVGDAAFANASVVKTLPSNVDFLGRARPDAALFALPCRKRLGRPPKKGSRVPSPKARARSARGWGRLRVVVHGRPVTLNFKLFDALWYSVSGARLMRLLLVRGWPGHQQDDVLCSTDLQTGAEQMISEYCLRWSLEVTFFEAKGRLGFEQPQNRTERAVERTAPMALWVYSLTVIWYLSQGKGSCPVPQLPWYRKRAPTFSDMLADLRRQCWHDRLSKASTDSATLQKSVASLFEVFAYAA
jgi:DDE superfamily endonuclease